MPKKNHLTLAVFAVLLLAVAGHCDDRSIWKRIIDFFSPTPAVTCEGPECDAIRNLDSQIGTLEGRYSRDRRPVHRDRFKKEMDSLQVIRDSLWTVVAAKQGSVGSSSSTQDTVPVSGAPETEISCTRDTVLVHDTVFVRDTVMLHDTLYVVVTNKPTVVPADSSNQQ